MNWGSLVKRIQALVLTICVCFTLVPTNVFAEGLDSKSQQNIDITTATDEETKPGSEAASKEETKPGSELASKEETKPGSEATSKEETKTDGEAGSKENSESDTDNIVDEKTKLYNEFDGEIQALNSEGAEAGLSISYDSKNLSESSLTITYGNFEPELLKIDNLESAGEYESAEIIYINAENYSSISGENNWETTAPSAVGKYYVGYIITFKDGNDISDYSNKYSFNIVKATLSAPQNLVFEEGTKACWEPSYSTEDDVSIDKSLVAGYKVALYKQNSSEDEPVLIVEKTVDQDTESYDFCDAIKGTNTYGRFYFTVSAKANETDCYDSSAASSSVNSSTDKYAYSILVKTQKPDGIKSVTPEEDASNILIPGTSTDISISLKATVSDTHSFSKWAVYADEEATTPVTSGLTLDNAGAQEENQLTISEDYEAPLLLYVRPEVKDVTAPVISDLRAGTLETTDDYTYGYLYGTATDVGAGLAAFAFSTKQSSRELTDSDWTAVDLTKEALSFSKMLTTDMEGGYYFLYVKDADGNIQKSSNYIPVTKANFINYYVDGNLVTPCVQMVVGQEKVPMQDSGSRPGYKFLGWDLTNENSDFLENQVTEFCATSDASITIYAKWEREKIQFSIQPEDVEKNYDGEAVTLEAAISNDSVGQVSWQWYRKVTGQADVKVGEEITNSKKATLTLINVTDSGLYYAQVTLKVTGEADRTGITDTASVSIAKAGLTITPANQEVSFGQAPVTDITDENHYIISGLKGEDSLSEVLENITLKFENSGDSTDYVAGDETYGKVGVYNIRVSGSAPENYSISVAEGKTLTVNAKNASDEASGVTIKLTDDAGETVTSMIYTSAGDNKPNITVFDETVADGGRNISTSDYDVEVTGNTGAGTATVKVTFKNNYSGSLITTYVLKKASLTKSDVTLAMSDFKYGEVTYPVLIGNPSDNNATVAYYYYNATSTKSTATTTKPTAVGSYKVYASITGGDRYEDVNTDSVAFTINKRKIVITSPSNSWEYDGKAHSDNVCTITGDGFASGEGFATEKILAGATITDVGTVDNTISSSAYSFKAGTSAENYEVELVAGKLTVVAARLGVPTGVKWTTEINGYKKNPAVATWDAVTVGGTDVSYIVQLYKDGVSLGEEVTLTGTYEYDFAEVIRKDSIENDATSSYSFAVKAVTTDSVTGRSSSENYIASSYSAISSTINTIAVYIGNDAGIKSVSIGGNEVYVASEVSLATTDSEYDGYYYMIAGETSLIVAKTYEEASFANVETIWETDPDCKDYFYVESTPSISLSDSDKTATGYIHLTDSASQSTVYRIFTHSDDERPSIIDFYATLSEDKQTVTFHIEAADSQAVIGWALIKDKALSEVRENNKDSAFKLNAWNSTPYEEDGKTRMTKHVEIDFSVPNDGSAAGDYTAYVTDYDKETDEKGGFGASDTITIYEISFDDGATSGVEGTMSSILKIKNQAVKLPQNQYTRTGYNFKGWKGNGGTTYIDEAAYSANENDTLKAQWTAMQFAYKVNYYVMDPETGSYQNTPTSTKSYTASYGASISYNNSTLYTTREGYELDSSKAQTITVKDNNQVLNIYYKCTEHTFTFIYTDPADNTSKAFKTLTLRTGQSVSSRAEIGNPDISGYEFNGWACPKVAEWPSVMPNENLEATGSFSAKEANYYFHFYTQDLSASTDETTGITLSSVGQTYTEVYKMSAEGNVYSLSATHNTSITATNIAIGQSTVPEIEGFSLAGIKYTNGPATNPGLLNAADLSSLETSVTTKANAAEGQEVNFYYYYTRNSYTISLNVVKDGSGGENLYSHAFDNKVYYGTAFTDEDYDYYENYGKAGWADGYITNEYDLKEDAIYSTGQRPAQMPAGNVYIEQVYVKKNLSQYSVLVYKELETEGQYPSTPDATLTYFDNEGKTISIDDELKARVEASFDESEYFEFDQENTKDTGGTVKAIDSNDPLIIKVYYKRIKTTATILFRYVNPEKNEYVTYGTLTKTGRWGTGFDVEALNFFREGRKDFTDGTYSSANVTFGGGAAEDYDYINNGYVAGYYLTYRLDGTKYVTYNYDSVAKLTENKTETFKKVNQTIYVTYQPSSAEASASFYVDMRYSTQKSNVEAARTEDSLTADLDGDSTTTGDIYPVRLRNLADIYESSLSTGAGDSAYSQYPGLGATVRSYTYKTDSDGNRILRSNFEAITYKEATYYLEDTDGDSRYDYICIGVSTNCFYQGGNGYFNYFSNSSYPGRDTLNEILSDYQTSYADTDEQAQAFYIYTNSFNETMTGNSTYTINFVYHDKCSVTWSANNKIYKASITYGSTLDIHSVDTLDSAPFKTDLPSGYKVVWYSDSNYTKEATGQVTVKSNGIYYGRYEKMEVEYNQYIYYELKDNLTLNGESIDYVTKENIAALMADDEIGPRITKRDFYYSDQATLVANNYYYETEYGSKVYYPIDQTAYYVDGTFAMVITKTRGITYSAETIDVTSERYLKGAGSGFVFDSSNSDNKINAYCQTSGVDLTAYFKRSEYLVYIAHSDDDSGNSVTSQAYRYGSNVAMDFPTKAGYTLAGCIVYTSETGADGSWKYEGYIGDDSKWHGEALPDSLQVSNSVYKAGTVGSSTAPFSYSISLEDSVTTITMPECNVRLETPWRVATYKKDFYHFYETENGTYDTATFEKMYMADNGAAGYTKESIKIYSYGELRDGTLYKYNGSVIGATMVITEGTKNYFGNVTAESGGYYSVDESDMIVIVSTKTVTEEQVIPIRSSYCALYDFIEQGNTANYEFEKLVVAKNNVAQATYSDYYNDSYSVKSIYQYAYYYSRKSGVNINVAIRMNPDYDTGETVAVPSGATVLGTGSYKFGNKATLKISLPDGYSLVNWFEAADVLDGYDAADNSNMDLLPLVEPLPASGLTNVYESTDYTFSVTGSADYVALIKADPVDEATLTVTGVKNTFSGDYVVGADNVLTATASFGEDSNTLVTGYQWYEKSGGVTTKIDGATEETYVFPKKTSLGTYTYICKATLKRRDNGRTGNITSNEYAITVTPADLSYTVDSYVGVYDGAGHSITVNITAEDKSEFEIYYSTATPLDEANYRLVGTTTSPTFTDVAVDSKGNAIGQNVYYYIHSSNYTDTAGSATVTITPKVLTVTRGRNFNKTYDGSTLIDGDVAEATSLKGQFVRNGSLEFTGYIGSDSNANVYADFTASFNSKDIDSASYILVSNIKMGSFDETGAFVQNYNYTVSSSAKYVTVYGSIQPLPLNVKWQTTGTTFNYDGKAHKPTATFDSDSKAILSKIGESGLELTVIGEQTDAGTGYSAFAMIDDSTDFDSDNYSLSNASTSFDISKLNVTVTAADRTVTYDGKYYGLDYDEVTVSGLAAGQQYIFSLADKQQKNAGTYTMSPSNLIVYTDSGKTAFATDNYNVTYVSATLTIKPRIVGISGITVSDKTYDGTETATISNEKRTVDGRECYVVTIKDSDGNNGIATGDTVLLDVSKVRAAFSGDDVITASAVGTNKTVSITYDDSPLYSDVSQNYQVLPELCQKSAKADISKALLHLYVTDTEAVYGEEVNIQTAIETEELVEADLNRIKSGQSQAAVLEKSGEVTVQLRKSDDQGNVSDGTEYETFEAGKTKAGYYEISIAGYTASAKNYYFVPATGDDSTALLTITKRPVEIVGVDVSTGATISKVYDGTTDAEAMLKNSMYKFVAVDGNSASGLLGEDKSLVDLSAFTANFDSKNVDAKSVIVSNMTLNNSNYEIANNSFILKGQITKKALCIKAKASDITYGSSPVFSYEIDETDSLTEEDAASYSDLTKIGLKYVTDYDTSDEAKRNTGTYSLSCTGLDGVLTNYAIAYVGTSFNVDKATITVTAKSYPSSGKLYFGQTIPQFEGSYAGTKYSDASLIETVYKDNVSYKAWDKDGNEIVQGQVSSVDAGTYTITTVFTDGIDDKLSNYKWEALDGKLTITKQTIAITGVEFHPRRFNNLYTIINTVQDEYIDLSKATATIENPPEGYASEYKWDAIWGTVVDNTDKSSYSSKGPRTNNKVTIRFTLADELADKYVINDIIINNATLNKALLYVYTKYNLTSTYGGTYKSPQFKTVIDYSGKACAYATTSYSPAHLKMVKKEEGKTYAQCYENAGYYSWTGDCPPVGEYWVYLQDYSVIDRQSSYFEIDYTYASRTMTVSAGKFTAPTLTWSDDESATVCFSQATDVGQVKPASYFVKLYKINSKGEEKSVAQATIPYVEGQENYSYSFASAIKSSGAGKYCAAITVNSSDTTNVTNSDKAYAYKTDGDKYIYAANVKISYATDDVTALGKSTDADAITIGGSTGEYLIVDMEKDVPVAVKAKNSGYVVSNWNCTADGVVDDNFVSYDTSYGVGVTSCKLKNATHLTSSTTREGVVTLSKVGATVSASFTTTTERNDFTIDFGYDAAHSASFTVTPGVENDNVTAEDYTYKYDWSYRENVAANYISFDEAHGNGGVTVTMPTGLNAGSGYQVRCTVTATRKDNGESISKNFYVNNFTGSVALHILRGNLISQTTMTKTSWTYGEARGLPGISYNPDKAEVTYVYSDNKDASIENWSETMLTDAGTHFVRARVARSTNFEAIDLEPISYTVSQATLPGVSKDSIKWISSDRAIFGMIEFNGVESSLPVENANTDGVSDSTVNINYEISLYRQENLGAAAELLKTVSCKPEDITAEGLCTYDFYDDIVNTGTGIYECSIKVVVDSTDEQGKKNCIASGDSGIDGLTGDALLYVYGNTYANKGDTKSTSLTASYGDNIYLSVESSSITVGSAEKQWYLTNENHTKEALTGATGDTLSIRDVSESGYYTCLLTTAGVKYYSIPSQITINKRAVTITSKDATKEYDGTALSETNFEIKNDDDTLWTRLDGASKTNTYTYTWPNGNTDTLSFDDGTTIINVSDSPARNAIEGLNVSNSSDYSITKVEGTLSITPRSLAKTGGLLEDDEAGLRSGISITNMSWPSEFVYEGAEFTPVIKVTDNSLATGKGFNLSSENDYTISYENNTSASTESSKARITVTGKGNYTGQISRTFIISKRPLEIASGSWTKKYDGNALTNASAVGTGDGYSLRNGTSFATGDYPVFTFTGSQTVKGQTDNAFSLVVKNSSGVDVTGDYDITTIFGTLTVEKAQGSIEFTKNGDAALALSQLNRVYDGTSLATTADPGWYTDNGALERSVSTSYEKITENGIEALAGSPKDAGNYRMTLSAPETSDYTAASVSIDFTISKRPVTFTAIDMSCTYHEEISDNLGTTFEGLVIEDYGDFIIDASTTATDSSDAGTYPIKLELLQSNDNYQVTLKDGTYTILKDDMTLVKKIWGIVDGAEAITFDNEDHTALEISLDEAMYQSGREEDNVTVYYSGSTELTADNYKTAGTTSPISYKNAGSYTIYYYAHSGKAGGNGNYNDVAGNTTLTINKANQQISFKAGTVFEKVYDSYPIENDLNVTVSSAYETDTGAEVSFSYQSFDGSSVDSNGIHVGSYKVVITAKETDNYNSASLEQKYVITKKPLSFRVTNYSHVYDGNPPDNSSGTIESSKLADKDVRVSISGEGSISNIDVGTYPLKLKDALIVYSVKMVTSEGITYENSGYAAYKDQVELGTIEYADGSVIYYVDRTSNYDITYLDSYYEITPATTTISINIPEADKAKYFDKVYDRTAVPQTFAKSWYTYSGDGNVTPVYYKVQEDGSLSEMTSYPMNAGKYALKLVASGRTAVTGGDGNTTYQGSGNYFTCESEVMTFEISKRSITLEAADGTSKYREQLSSLSTPAVTEGSICSGDLSSLSLGTKVVTDEETMTPVTYTSSVGNYVTVPTYSSNDNYSVTTVNGSYTITKATINATVSEGYSGAYDCDEHKAFSITLSGLPATENYTIYYRQTKMNSEDYKSNSTTSCLIKEVGSYSYYYYIHFDNYVDIASDTPITATIGEAAQRMELMVEEDELVYTYDGSAHGVNDGTVVAYTPESSGTDEADETGASITYKYYKQNSDGTYSDTAISGFPSIGGKYRVVATAAATGSYATATLRFYLTINKLPLTITTPDASKVFDGSPLSCETYEQVNGELLDGDSIDTVTFKGTIANVGTTSNAIKNFVIKNSSGVDVTDSYEITFIFGTLTVSKAVPSLTISSAAAGEFSKTYDGSEVTVTPSTWQNYVTFTGDTKIADAVTLAYYKVNEDGSGYTLLSSAPVNAGNYAIRLTAAASSNYDEATSDYLQFAIAKASAPTAVVNPYSGKYDGKSHTPLEITFDGIDETNQPVIYIASSPMTADNYGSLGTSGYEISLADTYNLYYYCHFENYEDVYSTSPETATVLVADQKIKFPKMTYTYDGKAKNLSESIYAVGEVLGEKTGANLTITYSGSEEAPSAVGTYEVIVKAEAIDGKYNETTEKAKLVIVKKEAGESYESETGATTAISTTTSTLAEAVKVTYTSEIGLDEIIEEESEEVAGGNDGKAEEIKPVNEENANKGGEDAVTDDDYFKNTIITEGSIDEKENGKPVVHLVENSIIMVVSGTGVVHLLKFTALKKYLLKVIALLKGIKKN